MLVKNYKKLRFGSISILITALIVAATVILNVVFSALASRFLWYIDMTREQVYTLSDDCVELLDHSINGYNDENGERIKGLNEKRADYNAENGLSEGDEGYKKPVQVTVYFCDDEDNLLGNSAMRYIYETARSLAREFDFLKIEFLNPVYNPTSVSKYTVTGQSISTVSVIFDADGYSVPGNNWRVYNQRTFFRVDSENTDRIVGYDGEKKFSAAILAITDAESPIACITVNHSESFYDLTLLELLYDAGYDIMRIDLSAKDFTFPEDARLVVVYNPRFDFQISDTGGIDEIERLDLFLDDHNSLMVFMDTYSPILPNFEEYLSTWGVDFNVRTDESGASSRFMLKDTSAYTLDNAGYTIRANYVTTGGLGQSIYSNMLDNGYSPPVIFRNAMSISYSSAFTPKTYEDADDHSKDYTYGYNNNKDGNSRNIYDVFTTSQNAVALANGAVISTASVGGASYGEWLITFADTDGAQYYVSREGDGFVIVDSEGKQLPNDGKDRFLTVAGNSIDVNEDGTEIISYSGATSVSVAETVIDYDGAAYSLASRQVTSGGRTNTEYYITDATGTEISRDAKGMYVTAGGSLLEILTVGGVRGISIYASGDSRLSETNQYKLMTITVQSDTAQEYYTTSPLNSYVVACGSTEFAKAKYLNSYGNSDVLLSVMTLIGRETVPVGLKFVYFGSSDIADITDAQATQYTLLLTILPPVVVFGLGIFVLVRRKYS